MRKNISKITGRLVLPLALITLLGCHFSSANYNREEDKMEAEPVIANFFLLLQNKDYNDTFPLFDKDFFKTTDTEDLLRVYSLVDEKLGSIRNYSLKDWKTQSVEGYNAGTTYEFVYSVKWEKDSGQVVFQLVKKDGKIGIIGCHVNSKALF